MNHTITDVYGIEVGHWTDRSHATGCTVVLCRLGAVAGVDVRGGAPGTRETDLLRPGNRVEKVHAVLLSGGSAYGLEAAAGVMRYLEEQGIGLRVGAALVPIVPAAIIFDLGLVSGDVRPGAAQGWQAAAEASDKVKEGSVGAGTGATVGKALGMARAVKGGVGTASMRLSDGAVVGALVVVNAYGGVVDPWTGGCVAGPRREDGKGFHSTTELLLRGKSKAVEPYPADNTTIGVVATNAPLDCGQATFLARVSHDGLALAIRPCHTLHDGDTLFALATAEPGIPSPDMVALGTAAVEVVVQAVLRAVRTAQGLGGVPGIAELGQ